LRHPPAARRVHVRYRFKYPPLRPPRPTLTSIAIEPMIFTARFSFQERVRFISTPKRNRISIDHPIRSASFRVPDYGSPRDSLLPDEGEEDAPMSTGQRPASVQREDIIRATRAQRIGIRPLNDSRFTQGIHVPSGTYLEKNEYPASLARRCVHGVRGFPYFPRIESKIMVSWHLH